ncbi:cyclophilin-like fold protein [Aestuariivirga sp. YIM B02566]|nr:cyclophilin-like fold protein [Aestuariivirga sp. YIM B02566]
MTSGLITRRTAFQVTILAAVTTPFSLVQIGRSYAQGSGAMKIRLSFNNLTMSATLEDNPSARDFAAMLPLDDLTIDNYANNEKISYLPRKLTEDGSGPFDSERPGDVCYYAPWGNLALFYAGYRWSQGLIRLGRIDGSFKPLQARGKFPLSIKLIR